MDRKPLDGRVEFRTAEKTVMYLDVEQKDGYEPFCLEYNVSGTFRGKAVRGVMFEYFPDDAPGMYYDINRQPDSDIFVGYLSEKPFREGKNSFCEYFSFIKETVLSNKSDMEVISSLNNTAYAYIDSNLLVQIGADYKNDLLKLVDGASLLNKNGFCINCSSIISATDKLLIPCGAYIGKDPDADLTDENIFSFGKAVFAFLFGRIPGIADRLFYSDWKRSEIVADVQINDHDFEILKNLLRLTLQVTRRSCLSDFNKIRDEVLKLK